jgi:hypothetical protein
MRLFLPVECGVESLFDQTLSDAKHGIHTDGEALSYLLIRPGRTLHIGFQQDIGMSYLVGCGFPFPGYLGQLAAFLSRKTYEVLFVHGTLRLSARSCLRRNDNLLTHKNKTDKPLAGVGDIDGDGVPDLAAGAPYQNVAGQGDRGQVFLFSGASGARLLTLNDTDPQAGAYFGLALAGVGDVDGDGVPDLAVGAPNKEVAGQDAQGQVFVFSGASGQLVLTLTKPSPQAQAQFGWTLAGVGDVDGDGVPDLAVGAPFQDVYDRQDQKRVVEPGRAFVFSLGATP